MSCSELAWKRVLPSGTTSSEVPKVCHDGQLEWKVADKLSVPLVAQARPLSRAIW